MELSWTDGQGVMQTVERLVKAIHNQIPDKWAIDIPKDEDFLRMKYEEAMSKHGSDKPDLRILDLVNKPSSLLL